MPPREYTPFQRFSGLKRTLLAGKERGTYDEKVVSLLLALVMALGLCTSAIAETNGESEDVQTGNETYTMETVLAGVDALTGNEAEKRR